MSEQVVGPEDSRRADGSDMKRWAIREGYIQAVELFGHAKGWSKFLETWSPEQALEAYRHATKQRLLILGGMSVLTCPVDQNGKADMLTSLGKPDDTFITATMRALSLGADVVFQDCLFGSGYHKPMIHEGSLIFEPLGKPGENFVSLAQAFARLSTV